jgi:cell division protein FtsL
MNTCIKCGCDDAYLSLPPCPTPEGCPNPPECAETYPAECVVISLADIVCGIDVVVFQGDSLVGALENIVNYFCQRLVTLTNFINAQLLIINGRLTTIEGNIVTIQGQIVTIQGNIVTINGQILTIQGDITNIESDILGIDSALTIIQGDITTLEGDVTTIQGDITTLQTTVNDLSACCDTKQKFISTNYLLTSADDGYSIIITNGATPISITVPTGLSAKLQVGFIQDGTGDVTFTPSGTTLNNAIAGYKIKGQYDQAYLEQGATSSIYYLLGNTKV